MDISSEGLKKAVVVGARMEVMGTLMCKMKNRWQAMRWTEEGKGEEGRAMVRKLMQMKRQLRQWQEAEDDEDKGAEN
jgi:hypothetical protein